MGGQKAVWKVRFVTAHRSHRLVNQLLTIKSISHSHTSNGFEVEHYRCLFKIKDEYSEISFGIYPRFHPETSRNKLETACKFRSSRFKASRSDK